MNKAFALFTIATASLFSFSHAANSAQHPFEKLTPKLVKSAEAWMSNAAQLLDSFDMQIVLNLFSLNDATEKTVKAIEKLLEEEISVTAVFGDLQKDIMTFISEYAMQIQNKNKKVVNTEEFEAALNQKIAELAQYIYTIYHYTLYRYMQENLDASYSTYIVDANGLIAPENRTTAITFDI